MKRIVGAAFLLSAFGIILAALYILVTYQRMFTGPKQDFAAEWRDLDKREAWVVAPLIAVIIVLGFFPKPVLDVLNPAVDRTMQQVQVVDPEPAVPPVAEGTQP